VSLGVDGVVGLVVSLAGSDLGESLGEASEASSDSCACLVRVARVGLLRPAAPTTRALRTSRNLSTNLDSSAESCAGSPSCGFSVSVEACVSPVGASFLGLGGGFAAPNWIYESKLILVHRRNIKLRKRNA